MAFVHAVEQDRDEDDGDDGIAVFFESENPPGHPLSHVHALVPII